MKNWRFYILVFVIFFCFSVVIFRLFTLQILKHSSYEAKAIGQQQTFQTVYPKRGEILLQDEYLVAINKDFYKVYAVPKDILEKEETAELLSPLLGIDAEKIKERIYKDNDPYEPLKSKLDEDTIQKIEDLNLEGIYLETEPKRYFPSNELACHLLGFVRQNEGEEDKGQYGVEEAYEKYLSGKTGLARFGKDSKGQLITINKEIIQKAEDGADLVLTVDPNIQFFAEQKLKEYIDKFHSTGGTIIVMDVKTGAIKAMANWPKFNPNEYGSVKNISVFANSAIHDLYEPGSVFKAITMAGALDKGVVNPQTTYDDKGKIEISGHVIENALQKGEGIQTMTQVLEKSLNTGAVFVQQKLGKAAFKEYVEKFGFADKTGIDLNGEVNGNISNLKTNRDLEFATASFGQGIAITPLQLVVAFGAIANDGVLMKPYVVDKIIKKDKEETIKPQEVRRVISSEATSRLTAILVSVVENGHTQRAGVDGYSIAAKTGTAQIPEKGGYSEETIHTVAGFFPAFEARFSMIVKLDKPIGARFAESTAAPLFGEITKYILNYYGIPPSE
ncbi:penicillin-binding protein 2 [Patescibacteria group bacterium]|nr:penicillin-binding protein 2 [Patescibacteria group bacterium]MBU4458593.1 penicillin-binding protein 2 [Patescibacteria group bacterium]MCG2696350.1 penicillin-binding protein 2 [Candidatus Portnoybacteria bacterium]